MFLVLKVSAVPEHLRGYLGRFLLEPSVGLFVGKVSVKVADDLWRRCCRAVLGGSVVMVRSDGSCEQGFRVSCYGLEGKELVDIDGLVFVKQL